MVSIKGDYGAYGEDTLKEIVDQILNVLELQLIQNTIKRL